MLLIILFCSTFSNLPLGAPVEYLIVQYCHLSCISEFVSPYGFIPEILLAAFEMQISCLATVRGFRI